MANAIPLNQISRVIGQAAAKGNIAGMVTKQAVSTAQKSSVELFGYDFTGLVVKLVVYFGLALIFSKIMEGIILARGGFVQFANLLGINIPQSEQMPDSLKKLFDGGINGFKFWDIIKVIAILLVIMEYLRYSQSIKNLNAKVSPMTSGVFILLIVIMGITTIPELHKRIKMTDLNLDQFK